MAPFSLPTANGSSSTSANATFEVPSPQPMPCQPVGQNQWGPDSISNIVFGLVMVFISLFAIYQTRRQRLHESDVMLQDVREKVIGAENEMAASSASLKSLGERGKLECEGKDEEDGEGISPQVGKFTRTDTDMTLVEWGRRG